MSDEQKQEQTSQEQAPITATPQLRRQVVIETDGNNIWVTKNESVGVLELKAILTSILTSLK